MNPIIRNILAVIIGIVVGGIVNMGIIKISGSIIPPPEGADLTNMESLKYSMHLFEARHFIFPFLAHALGALVGAFVAGMSAMNHKLKLAIGIGAFFLLGGIASVFMLPAPVWFSVLDLVVAYIPMGWLGGQLALALNK